MGAPWSSLRMREREGEKREDWLSIYFVLMQVSLWACNECSRNERKLRMVNGENETQQNIEVRFLC